MAISILGRTRFKNTGLTLMEILLAVVIIGILASFAIPMYMNSVERARSVEVYPIFEQVRRGYLARRMEGMSVARADWNPNIACNSINNPAWEAIGVENPNCNTERYFVYDVWDNIFSQDKVLLQLMLIGM